MKIDIEVFELPGSIINNVKKCYIELLPDRIIYVHDYNIDVSENEDSEEESYHEEPKEFRVTDKATYKKECVTGVAISTKRIFGINKEGEEESMDVCECMIPLSGLDDAIVITFNTIKKANDFHKLITDYIFNDSKSIH